MTYVDDTIFWHQCGTAKNANRSVLIYIMFQKTSPFLILSNSDTSTNFHKIWRATSCGSLLQIVLILFTSL